MPDFSISNASINKGVKSVSKENGKYQTLKDEYDKTKRKIGNTDFANAPVILEKELAVIAELKDAAIKEGLEEEVKQLESREQAIYTQLANRAKMPVSAAFYPQVAFKGSFNNLSYNIPGEKKEAADLTSEHYGEPDIEEQDYVSLYSAAYENFIPNENSCAIVDMLGRKGYGTANTAYILKKCADDDGSVPDDKVEALKLFTDASISSAAIPQMLEELVINSPSDTEIKMDLDACRKVCDIKSIGFTDFESIKLAKFFKDNLEDESSVMNSVKKMFLSGISSDSAFKILNILKTNNPNTGLNKVSSSSVQSLCRMKKSMALSRNNEKLERDNPINRLGVQMFTFDDNVMVIKDGKITYITPVEGETVHELQQEYDELVSKIEDNLLCEFAAKYKDSNGEIDSKYARTLIALRHKGVTYGQLLNMLDMCVSKDGSINKNMISVIGNLKESGALSDDIPVILEACEKDAEGNYKSEDIEIAAELSKAVISGNQIAEFMPDIKSNGNIKDFIISFSPFFEDRKLLSELVTLVKDDNGNIDENAMDVVYNLAENILNSDNPVKEKDFMDYANMIVYAAMNDEDDKVNDEGAGIVAIMCQNRKSPEDIVSVLDACRDFKGAIDEKLSDIVWNMSHQKAETSQILDLLSACKSNYNMTDTIISYFDSGIPMDKILKFALD